MLTAGLVLSDADQQPAGSVIIHVHVLMFVVKSTNYKYVFKIMLFLYSRFHECFTCAL